MQGMTLSNVPNGKSVDIVAVSMGEGSVIRLSSLGLFPGARIRVVCNSTPKVSVIECLGARWALGRGVPDFIEVR